MNSNPPKSYLFPEWFTEEECLKDTVAVAGVTEVNQSEVVLVDRVLCTNVAFQLGAGTTHYTPPGGV